jgi:hypothetical protein
MPRIRTIKPAFFTDSEIGKLKPLARLFFIGLWCHADKAGRMEDRMEELATMILPYDVFSGKITADKLMNELSPKFITRYKHRGSDYIQINNFSKHQRPNNSEHKSKIVGPKGKPK